MLNGLLMDVDGVSYLIHIGLGPIILPATMHGTTLIINGNPCVVSGDIDDCSGHLCPVNDTLTIDNFNIVAVSDVILPLDGQYLYVMEDLLVRSILLMSYQRMSHVPLISHRVVKQLSNTITMDTK